MTEIKVKGIVKNAVKKFNIDKLKAILKTGIDSETTMQYKIQSKDHKLYTIEDHKKNSRLMDDKRYIMLEVNNLGDGKMVCATSRAIGHCRNSL